MINFDKETTRKLTKIFYQMAPWREDFANLMRGLGIDQINCGEYHNTISGEDRHYLPEDQEETIIGDCDRLQGCVLIFDPSFGHCGGRYLLIPKELAEKILIPGWCENWLKSNGPKSSPQTAEELRLKLRGGE